MVTWNLVGLKQHQLHDQVGHRFNLLPFFFCVFFFQAIDFDVTTPPPISFLEKVQKFILESLVAAARDGEQSRFSGLESKKQNQTAESFFAAVAAALTEGRLLGLIKTSASHLKSQQTADKIDPGRDETRRANSTCLRKRIEKEFAVFFADGISVAHSSSEPGGAALWLSL